MWELMSLLTCVMVLRQKNDEAAVDDFVRSFDVDPDGLAAYIEDKVPTHPWWQCALSRAREHQSEELGETEARDWAAIGNFTLGLYAVHSHKPDYPLSLPNMIRLYTEVGLLQARGQAPVEVVTGAEDLKLFNEASEAFWAAIDRRQQSLEAIPDDAVMNAPILVLTPVEAEA
jgi:hypothetical protein